MMPDFYAAFNSILSKFKTEMDSRQPDVPIAWPNMQFDPSTDFDASSHDGWCRIVIMGGEAAQASAGGPGQRRWRHWGQITVQVFTLQDRGAPAAIAIADDVATGLRGVVAEDVVIGAPIVRPIGQEQEGWYQVNVEAPFRFDLFEGTSGVAYSSDVETQGTWTNPLLLNGAYIWYDATNAVMRMSTTAPTSETDGLILVTASEG